MPSPYFTAKNFNAVANLHDAHTAFTAANGPSILETIFKPMLLQYGLESTFGISLLYKHFDLSDEDILVEHGRTTTLRHCHIKIPPGTAILPSAWMITPEGTMMAYRFYFTEEGTQQRLNLADDSFSYFINDFIRRAYEYNIEGLVALRLLPQNGLICSVEMLTEVDPLPRINIFPTQEFSDRQFRSMKQVSWFFDQHYGIARYLSPCPCPCFGGQMSMGNTAGVQSRGQNWLPNHASEETRRAPEPGGLGYTVTRAGSDNGGKYFGPKNPSLPRDFTNLLKDRHGPP